MSLPEKPSQRRIIVVLEEAAYDRLSYDPQASEWIRPEVAALLWPAELDDPLALELERRSLARPGEVLIQSPYDMQEYAPLDEAAELFGQQKFALFSRLCQMLGARDVAVVAMQEERNGELRSVEVKAGRGPIKTSASYRGEGLDRLAANLSWRDVYQGADPQIREAKEFLRDRGLQGDPVLSSLIESREDGHNRHNSRDLTVDLTRESDRTLTAAAGLKIPVALELAGNFHKKEFHHSKFRVQYRVEF